MIGQKTISAGRDAVLFVCTLLDYFVLLCKFKSSIIVCNLKIGYLFFV